MLMNGVLINITFGHLENFPILFTALLYFYILKLVKSSILITICLSFEPLLIISYNIHDG